MAIKKFSLKKIMKEAWLYGVIIAVYFALYFKQIDIANESIALATAFEVDPGSILGAIHNLYSNKFNMQLSYHSKYYGWTFYAIASYISMPMRVYSEFVNPIETSVFLYFYRLIFLAIGGLAVISLTNILNIVTNQKRFLMLFLAIVFMVSPSSELFYYLHPESTGVLFLFIAIILLLKNVKLDLMHFSLLLLCLALSALSKQIFVFASFPLYIYAFYNTAIAGKSKIQGLYFKLAISVIIGFFTTLLINPFIFFKFSDFYLHQKELSEGFQSNTYTFLGSSLAWFKVMVQYPFSLISIGSCFFCILKTIFQSDKSKLNMALLPISLSVIITYAAIFYGNRHWFLFHYLVLPYSLSLIPLAYLLSEIYSKKFFVYKILLFSLIGYSAIFTYDQYSNLNKTLNSRADYKNTPSYQSYQYLKSILTKEDRVAYDHNISMPDEFIRNGCSYWQGCGEHYINEFSPNYVIYVETENSISPMQYANLLSYIDGNKFILVKNLEITCCNEPARNIKIFKRQ